MKPVMRCIIAFMLASCLPAGRQAASYAQGVASDELIKNARMYDGKVVAYEGEVIGEVMRRGEYAWVNVNDGKNAIGIWMPFSFTETIAYAGSYASKGDWIEISGVFRHSCPEHGGDLDIHALSFRKVNIGRPLNKRLNPGKKNFALVLAGAVCLVMILKQLHLNLPRKLKR